MPSEYVSISSLDIGSRTSRLSQCSLVVSQDSLEVVGGDDRGFFGLFFFFFSFLFFLISMERPSRKL